MICPNCLSNNKNNATVCQNCGYSLIEEDLDLEQAVIKEQEDEQNIEDELAQNNQIPAIEYSDEELQAGDAISADDGQPSEEEQKTISIPQTTPIIKSNPLCAQPLPSSYGCLL